MHVTSLIFRVRPFLSPHPPPIPSIYPSSFIFDSHTIQLRATASALLSKTTSFMETIVSNSMPVFVSSRFPVRAVSAPRQLQFSCFTPRTTLFGSCTQGKLGFRCFTVGRAAVTCGVVTEIKEAQFSDVVLKANTPVLVEFVANWCGPCRLISPAMESIAKEYGDRLTVVKIDHDANPRLIEDYKVYGLPTLILFQNGKEVPESRREGAITKAKLKDYVDALLESIPVV